MIQPITCDITQQNATAHPQNPIKTTNLTATLPTCGSECCPLGYTCQNGNQCVIDPTPSASTTSSTSASASIVPTLVPIVTAPANSGNATVEAHCDAFPAKAVVAGFFPGMILGALLAALAFCLLRRTKKNRQSGDFGHVSATVSDPIYQPQQTAMRSDFLRRGSASDQRSSKVRSLFSKSSPITPTPKQKQRDGIGRSIKPEIKKEPSTESINIFAPPNLRPGSNMTRKTTFSDMMENAGFPKNAPYAIVEGERLRRNG
ncbi:MAG: hypothetical protein M1827_000652 [Pycnora praestabilis]|nr:MAG: hypothetical protein M1827_000652 [Pycnora praestabilis]